MLRVSSLSKDRGYTKLAMVNTSTHSMIIKHLNKSTQSIANLVHVYTECSTLTVTNQHPLKAPLLPFLAEKEHTLAFCNFQSFILKNTTVSVPMRVTFFDLAQFHHNFS